MVIIHYIEHLINIELIKWSGHQRWKYTHRIKKKMVRNSLRSNELIQQDLNSHFNVTLSILDQVECGKQIRIITLKERKKRVSCQFEDVTCFA